MLCVVHVSLLKSKLRSCLICRTRLWQNLNKLVVNSYKFGSIIFYCRSAISIIMLCVCLWHCALWPIDTSYCISVCLNKWIGSAILGTQWYNFNPLHWSSGLKLSTSKISNAVWRRVHTLRGIHYAHMTHMKITWCIIFSQSKFPAQSDRLSQQRLCCASYCICEWQFWPCDPTEA